MDESRAITSTAPTAPMTPEECDALEALVPQLERIRVAAGAIGVIGGRLEDAAQHRSLTEDERRALARFRAEMSRLAAELEAIERRLDLERLMQRRDAA